VRPAAILWLYITAGGVGALLGVVSILACEVLAVSVVVVAIAVALMRLQHWALVAVPVNAFMLLPTLQSGYFLALMQSGA